eukprot:283981-Pleurochrysis_carterae.AAC.4
MAASLREVALARAACSLSTAARMNGYGCGLLMGVVEAPCRCANLSMTPTLEKVSGNSPCWPCSQWRLSRLSPGDERANDVGGALSNTSISPMPCSPRRCLDEVVAGRVQGRAEVRVPKAHVDRRGAVRHRQIADQALAAPVPCRACLAHLVEAEVTRVLCVGGSGREAAEAARRVARVEAVDVLPDELDELAGDRLGILELGKVPRLGQPDDLSLGQLCRQLDGLRHEVRVVGAGEEQRWSAQVRVVGD